MLLNKEEKLKINLQLFAGEDDDTTDDEIVEDGNTTEQGFVTKEELTGILTEQFGGFAKTLMEQLKPKEEPKPAEQPKPKEEIKLGEGNEKLEALLGGILEKVDGLGQEINSVKTDINKSKTSSKVDELVSRGLDISDLEGLPEKVLDTMLKITPKKQALPKNDDIAKMNGVNKKPETKVAKTAESSLYKRLGF